MEVTLLVAALPNGAAIVGFDVAGIAEGNEVSRGTVGLVIVDMVNG